MEKIIIVAISQNNVIGVNGGIPWHSKEDFRHFKQTTMGSPLIMGRKTYESIGKPLPGRLNVVVSRTTEYEGEKENLIGFHSLRGAFEHCRQMGYEKVFVIGGGEIYNEVFNDVDKLIVSRMKLTVDNGDTFFPEIKEDDWNLDEVKHYDEFDVHYYSRKD